MPFGVQSLIPIRLPNIALGSAVSSPMPFGVQSLIPRLAFPESNTPEKQGLQCLSAFSPLFPKKNSPIKRLRNKLSPMPFGVQSLIPDVKRSRDQSLR